MERGNTKITYAEMPDDAISPELKHDITKVKGLFLYPSQLFVNVVKNAATNENLNTDLANIFTEIENSANGFASEKAVKGLFVDFDTTSHRLGAIDRNRSARLADVLNGVAGLKLDNFDDSEIDIFDNAYEFLIHNYAASAGKSGGKFFTSQNMYQNCWHGLSCTDKPISTRFMIRLAVLVHYCCAPKSSLMTILLKKTFGVRKSTIPTTILPA